jgi:hypothetical protein
MGEDVSFKFGGKPSYEFWGLILNIYKTVKLVKVRVIFVLINKTVLQSLIKLISLNHILYICFISINYIYCKYLQCSFVVQNNLEESSVINLIYSEEELFSYK